MLEDRKYIISVDIKANKNQKTHILKSKKYKRSANIEQSKKQPFTSWSSKDI